MDCKFTLINKYQLQIIKPLWIELNNIHFNDSYYFKDHYRSFSFEQRCEKFNDIIDDNIRIEIVEDNDTAAIIGYCIATIENGNGEIDSLYVDVMYQKYGLGGKLVESSIQWLKLNSCKKIMVAVAEGHESVFTFYQKYHLYPRMTYLQMKE